MRTCVPVGVGGVCGCECPQRPEEALAPTEVESWTNSTRSQLLGHLSSPQFPVTYGNKNVSVCLKAKNNYTD